MTSNELNSGNIQDINQETDRLTNIINKIRFSLTEKDILQNTVEIIRQVLAGERVVIYSLQEQLRGTIIAESVDSNFPKTLGLKIEDPCFEYRYIDQYQKGRVRAIANIYEAGMTPCYLENLEKIGVKANLVLPLLLSNNSIYGLLVIHQCSSTRNWQKSEITLAMEIVRQVGFALEDAYIIEKYNQLQAKFKQSVQWQKLLWDKTQTIYTAKTSSEVLEIGVDTVKEVLNCDRVVVYSLRKQQQGKIVAESTLPALAPLKGTVIQDPCFEYRYIDKYQKGRVKAIANIYEAGMTSCYIENLEKIAVKANLVTPILREGEQILGLLVAHQCFGFRYWQSEEIEWMKQFALQIGLAWEKGKLKEQISLLKSNLVKAEIVLKSNLVKVETVYEALERLNNKMKEIEKSVQGMSQNSSELNNLTKLLNREISSLIEDNLIQETKLMQIIAKKLVLNADQSKDLVESFQLNANEIENLLENAISALSFANEESTSSDVD
jgi:methyl-accepting chemotaxis protein PixJ